MKIKAIITGASGMVGEGILLECLRNPLVEKVLVVGRRPCGVTHVKLQEVIHADFFNLTDIESKLAGYNACYFCLGTSSVGLSEEQYSRVTYDLTVNFAKTLARLNSDLTFCYVTGAGTDSSETGKVAWARVKGKTENAVMRIFKKSYMFRSAAMQATSGQKNLKFYYHLFAWVFPIGRKLLPSVFCTLQEVGQAMIQLTIKGYPKQIITMTDIAKLSKMNELEQI